MFPTTCPHFDIGLLIANSQTHPAPVITRNIVSEWSCTNSRSGLSQWCGGRRLSADPISKKNFVASTVTSRPLQSAIALPKNDPQCVLGLDRAYRTIHVMRMIPETRLRECCSKNDR